MITVAVPFYGNPALLPKAVDSILQQSYSDLRVLVIADGQETPPLPPDPRLTVYRLPENRGTYFATAVALAACETEWFTIHAADDWSEPDRFACLMAHAGEVDAVFGGSVQHNGRSVSGRLAKFHRGGRRPKHVGSIATGIYRTEAIKSLGWWSHPEFRVGYDSMMVNLVLRHLRWTHVRGEYGYHRVVNPNSLTRSKATGLHSKYRLRAAEMRSRLWDQYKDNPAAMQPDPAIAAEVMEHNERLRRVL